MTDRNTYMKYDRDTMNEIKSDLDQTVGSCDFMADNGNYEKAYKKLRQELNVFRSAMLEESELHFE